MPYFFPFLGFYKPRYPSWVISGEPYWKQAAGFYQAGGIQV